MADRTKGVLNIFLSNLAASADKKCGFSDQNMTMNRPYTARILTSLVSSALQRRQNHRQPTNIDAFRDHVLIFVDFRIKTWPRIDLTLNGFLRAWCRWIAGALNYRTTSKPSPTDQY